MPYNLFTIGGVTPDALNYLQVPGLQQGTIEQEVYTASVTGDLGGIGLQSPFASESIKVAFGVEKRFDRLSQRDRRPARNCGAVGYGRPARSACRARPRCWTTSPSCGSRWCRMRRSRISSDSSMAYRYSDYDTDTTDTYKIGIDWAPIQDVRFRGSFQRAVRAANVVELFTAQGFNLFDLPGDPCGADLIGTDGEASRDACLATGVPAAVFDNPATRRRWTALPASTTSCRAATSICVPEESDTYTYGVILQPRFLPKLAMSIDYFDIEIKDTISTFGADNIAERLLLHRTTRWPATASIATTNGSLWRGDGHVEDLNINIGCARRPRAGT